MATVDMCIVDLHLMDNSAGSESILFLTESDLESYKN